MRQLLIFPIVFGCAGHLFAAVPFNGGQYTQNFNSLGTGAVPWTDNDTLPGWYLHQSATGGPPAQLNEPLEAGTRSGSGTSGSKGFWFNFGTDADRAIGGSPAGGTGTKSYGVALTNNTGSVIEEVSISFDWERWFLADANSNVPQNMRFHWSTDATSLTDGTYTQELDGLLTLGGPAPPSAEQVWLETPEVYHREFTIEGIDWQPGETLWLRWQDINEPGGDHGVGINNFVLSTGDSPPRIADFQYNPEDGSAEVTIVDAIPNGRYKLVESADMDFSNPDRDPVPLLGATTGSLFDGLYLIADEEGVATVQFNLGTAPANFVRAEQVGAIAIAEFDFENDGQGFTPTGDWEWGTPASDNGEPNGEVIGGNNGSNGAWATNLGDGSDGITGTITIETDSILRSPDVDLTGVSGARLEFAASVDAQTGDTLEVRVRDASDDSLLQTITPFPGGFPANVDWQTLGPFEFSEDVDDRNIYLEFRFLGLSDLFLGFYLDDVKISF